MFLLKNLSAIIASNFVLTGQRGDTFFIRMHNPRSTAIGDNAAAHSHPAGDESGESSHDGDD